MRPTIGEAFPFRITMGTGLTFILGAVGSVFILIHGVKYLSQVSQCRQRSQQQQQQNKKKKRDNHCYLCNIKVDLEDPTTFVPCRNCDQTICRGRYCSDWDRSTGYWECMSCIRNRDSQLRAGEWILEQLNQRFRGSSRSTIINKDEISVKDAEIHSEKSYSGSNFSISNEQKEKVRAFLEDVIASMVGGPLDDVPVGHIHKHPQYLQFFKRFHSHLSESLYDLENSIHRSLNDLPLWDHECPGLSHINLKRLIQKIIEEALKLPNLFNHSGIPARPEEHLPYFDAKKYEQLLATAVLNKVVDCYQNNKNLPYPENSSGIHSGSEFDSNHNAVTEKEQQIGFASTSSSIEPRSDSSAAGSVIGQPMSLTIEEFVEEVSPQGSFETNSHRSNQSRRSDNEESYLSDYIQNHRVPLPDLSAESDGTESELQSLQSNGTEGTWEENWLFKKRKLKSDANAAIAMLVPSPTEEVKALIGDQNVDEVSDLSEAGSDVEDAESESSDDDNKKGKNGKELPSVLLQNKTVIGGKNELTAFDHNRPIGDLLQPDSLTSNPAEESDSNAQDAGIAEAKNELVLIEGDFVKVDNPNNIVDEERHEAINTSVGVLSNVETTYNDQKRMEIFLEVKEVENVKQKTAIETEKPIPAPRKTSRDEQRLPPVAVSERPEKTDTEQQLVDLGVDTPNPSIGGVEHRALQNEATEIELENKLNDVSNDDQQEQDKNEPELLSSFPDNASCVADKVSSTTNTHKPNNDFKIESLNDDPDAIVTRNETESVTSDSPTKFFSLTEDNHTLFSSSSADGCDLNCEEDGTNTPNNEAVTEESSLNDSDSLQMPLFLDELKPVDPPQPGDYDVWKIKKDFSSETEEINNPISVEPNSENEVKEVNDGICTPLGHEIDYNFSFLCEFKPENNPSPNQEFCYSGHELYSTSSYLIDLKPDTIPAQADDTVIASRSEWIFLQGGWKKDNAEENITANSGQYCKDLIEISDDSDVMQPEPELIERTHHFPTTFLNELKPETEPLIVNSADDEKVEQFEKESPFEEAAEESSEITKEMVENISEQTPEISGSERSNPSSTAITERQVSQLPPIENLPTPELELNQTEEFVCVMTFNPETRQIVCGMPISKNHFREEFNSLESIEEAANDQENQNSNVEIKSDSSDVAINNDYSSALEEDGNTNEINLEKSINCHGVEMQPANVLMEVYNGVNNENRSCGEVIDKNEQKSPDDDDENSIADRDQSCEETNKKEAQKEEIQEEKPMTKAIVAIVCNKGFNKSCDKHEDESNQISQDAGAELKEQIFILVDDTANNPKETSSIPNIVAEEQDFQPENVQSLTIEIVCDKSLNRNSDQETDSIKTENRNSFEKDEMQEIPPPGTEKQENVNDQELTCGERSNELNEEVQENESKSDHLAKENIPCEASIVIKQLSLIIRPEKELSESTEKEKISTLEKKERPDSLKITTTSDESPNKIHPRYQSPLFQALLPKIPPIIVKSGRTSCDDSFPSSSDESFNVAPIPSSSVPVMKSNETNIDDDDNGNNKEDLLTSTVEDKSTNQTTNLISIETDSKIHDDNIFIEVVLNVKSESANQKQHSPSGERDDHLIPGSIAEREHMKWLHATVEMPNNPYSAEALQKRLKETSGTKPIDVGHLVTKSSVALDDTEPMIEVPPKPVERSLQVILGEGEPDHQRYGRDYYINDAKKASGTRKRVTTDLIKTQTSTDDDENSFHAVPAESETVFASTPLIRRSSSYGDDEGPGDNSNIFAAKPIQVEEDDPILSRATRIDYLSNSHHEYNLLTAEDARNYSFPSSDTSLVSLTQSESLIHSEDSDTTRIYDLNTRETKLLRENVLKNAKVAIGAVPDVSPSPSNVTHEESILQPVRTLKEEKLINVTPKHISHKVIEIEPVNADSKSLSATSTYKQLSPDTLKYFAPKKSQPFLNKQQQLPESDEAIDVKSLNGSNSIDNRRETVDLVNKLVIEKEVLPSLPSVKQLANVFSSSKTEKKSGPIQKPKTLIWQQTKEDQTPVRVETPPPKAASPENETTMVATVKQPVVVNVKQNHPFVPGHSITARSLSKQFREELKNSTKQSEENNNNISISISISTDKEKEKEEKEKQHSSPERPSSPVLTPGKLKNNIAFFENLKKQ